MSGMPAGIGFGGASVGNLRRAISDEQADAAVRRAWARGIRYYDTAPHYGLGLSERRLGATLGTLPRDEFCLSTKVGRLLVKRDVPLEQDDDGFVVPGDLKRVWDFSPDGVRRSVESSLERLGVARIEVLYVHDPDQAGPGAAREGLASLQVLKKEGLASAVGIGTNATEGLAELVDEGLIDVLMLANRYTLLDHREALPVFAAARRSGTRIVAAGVFNSGLLATPRPVEGARFDYREAQGDLVVKVNRIADVCESHGVDVPTAAIAFAFLQPVVISVVLGMRSDADVDQNMDRYQTVVPKGLWSDLAAEGLVAPEATPRVGGSDE
jgi:D-threo-aldose 1-dehydrogenase